METYICQVLENGRVRVVEQARDFAVAEAAWLIDSYPYSNYHYFLATVALGPA